MGSRGRGLLAKLLGSVAEGVIKKTRIPVLIIKKESENVFDRVLFAYHPLNFSNTIVNCIRKIPCKEMILLHVIEPILPPETSKRLMEEKTRDSEEILNKVKSKLEDTVKVDVFIRSGNPAKELIEVAKEFGATCIVLGSRVKRPMLGSTTSYILSHSEVPILVCKGLLDQ